MNPILFLDFDGVLNNVGTRPINPQGLADWIEPRNLAVANELVIRTGASVVVSSAWRRGTTPKKLDRLLAGCGFVGEVRDVTPYLPIGPRWQEIRAWLGPRRLKRFLILDDEHDMGELAPFHVRTSPLHGFSQDDLPAALQILGVEEVTPVHFFDPTVRPFGALSNFSEHPITLDGKLWLTAEHYYQAQKFTGTNQDAIRSAPSAHEAKRQARRQTQHIRSDWDQVKENVMHETLEAKFRSHLIPCAILLATGERPIAEASPHDGYWGLGADGKGRNRLGEMLMEVRGSMQRAQGGR